MATDTAGRRLAQPSVPHTLSGVSARTLRATNLSLVLRYVLAFPGAVSRADIASRTGITRATVSRLVDELIRADLLVEGEPTSDSGRGRPAIRLAPAPGRAVSLGAEVNVSSLGVHLVDLTGAVIAETTIDGNFAGTSPSETMQHLADLAHALLAESLPHGALFAGTGLALPGLVSPQSLALAPNLGWRDIKLFDLLKPLRDLDPTIVANEADLAAYAVARPRPGVPDGPASFVYVSGEVGVGAGIIIDHHPLTGAHGWSGEIGHICTDPNGPRCSCGATGCLEAYLGRRALARNAGMPPETRPSSVVQASETGSSMASRALEVSGTALGRALSAVINTVDIPLVILGGNVADIAPALVEPARRELETRVLQSAWSHPEIRIVEHSEHLAALGAAHRVLQGLVDDPLAWTA